MNQFLVNIKKSLQEQSLISKTSKSVKKTLARLEIINPFTSLFKEIEFETLSYCNRKCVYCPNADWERFGDNNNFFMSDPVFKVLIEQLADLEFKGLIAPHLYGEPMSDPRLTRWVKHMRNKLPKCTIKIVTNGDYLNVNSYEQLLGAGVDVIYISKHSKQLKKKCLQLLDSLSANDRKNHIVLNDFYSDFDNSQSMFTNRGGDIELKVEIEKTPPVNCNYATYPVINTFGDMIICCQDFQNKYIFGNIMERHLGEIWYDESNIKLRKRIFKSNFDLSICQNCKM